MCGGKCERDDQCCVTKSHVSHEVHVAGEQFYGWAESKTTIMLTSLKPAYNSSQRKHQQTAAQPIQLITLTTLKRDDDSYFIHLHANQ